MLKDLEIELATGGSENSPIESRLVVRSAIFELPLRNKVEDKGPTSTMAVKSLVIQIMSGS